MELLFISSKWPHGFTNAIKHIILKEYLNKRSKYMSITITNFSFFFENHMDVLQPNKKNQESSIGIKYEFKQKEDKSNTWPLRKWEFFN